MRPYLVQVLAQVHVLFLSHIMCMFRHFYYVCDSVDVYVAAAASDSDSVYASAAASDYDSECGYGCG